MLLIIALVTLAAALLLAETLLPGGVAGMLGVVSLAGAIALTYSRYGTPTGHYVLAGLVVSFTVAGIAWMSIFPQTELGQRMWFKGNAVPRANEPKTELLGKLGVAETPLRPSGTARILGDRYDVITQGEFVETDAKIEVIKVAGNRIEVRPHREALPDEETVVS